MNEPLFDLTRWFGAFPVILQLLADDPLLTVAGGVLLFGFGWLITYRQQSKADRQPEAEE